MFESTDTCAKEQVLSLLYKQHGEREREMEVGWKGGRERESGVTHHSNFDLSTGHPVKTN